MPSFDLRIDKDWVQTQDAGLNILEIRGIKLDDQATYTCKARNSQGQTVSECFLKIVVVNRNCLPLSPPMFLRPVLDIVVPSEGHTARFECQVHPGSNSSEHTTSSSSTLHM
ncbi:titin-like [Symsagittifera roscoffensis]|uniref:titin-like n=1 Tax=Symsagittifera roscoffensis TaxID=84072 RepID=UPI00307B3970